MKELKFKLLPIFTFCLFYTIGCIAQDTTQTEESKAPVETEAELDISDNHLNTLFKLQDFYSAQVKKRKIPDSLMAEYRRELKNTETEIAMIKEKRISYAKKVSVTNPHLLEKEEFFFQFREMDRALAVNDPPTIYANEVGSLIFNGGVTLLGLKKYSFPVVISGEKILNEKFSVGGYVAHFIEKVIVDSLLPEENGFYKANFENYKHNHFGIGIKGSYHFFDPLGNLNPEKIDLYISAIAGYTITTGTIPFLNNEQYLPNSKFNDAIKKGVNYGIFAGIRYMYDRNIGFFAEAGYSHTGYLSGGVTLRFVGKYVSSGKEEDIIEFKVKLFSTSRRVRPTSKKFKDLTAVEEYIQKKVYTYMLTPEGAYYASANKLQQELSKKKFREAEVIAFKNGVLITVKKALKILRKSQPAESSPFD